LDFSYADGGVNQFSEQGTGERLDSVLGCCIDASSGVGFPAGNGTNVNDVSGLFSLEVLRYTFKSCGIQGMKCRQPRTNSCVMDINPKTLVFGVSNEITGLQGRRPAYRKHPLDVGICYISDTFDTKHKPGVIYCVKFTLSRGIGTSDILHSPKTSTSRRSEGTFCHKSATCALSETSNCIVAILTS
jgi:hypothetical protein